MLIKNISYSVLFKIFGMALSLIMVPLLLEVLGVNNYGVWVSLTSLIVWVSLFDFGMGNALKNSVSKSLAIDDVSLARDEFLQVLKLTLITSGFILLLFFLSIFFVDFFRENLTVSLILFLPVIMLFPLKVGNFVLQGARKIALESFLVFLNIFLYFVFVFVLYFMDLSLSIELLSSIFIFCYSVSLFCVFFCAAKVIGFNIRNVDDVFIVNFDFVRIKLGVKFFGLQLSSLVLYSFGTIITYSFLSSEDAALFDVVNKIFVFGLSFFTIIIGIFWPEISTAIAKKENKLIKSLYYKMLIFSLFFSTCAVLVAYFSPYVVDIWTGSKLKVSREQSIYFAALVSIQAFAYSGAVVLNAYEKINFQLVLSLIATVLMFPLSLHFIDSGLSIASIPLASASLTFFTAIYCNVHAFQLMRKE